MTTTLTHGESVAPTMALRAGKLTHACMYAHTHAHAHMHTYTHTYTHTYMHVHTHTHTHTRAHIHTHRCNFHESLDCSHCSLGISHTYCYVMSELLCRRYNVSITRNHLSILPPVKGAVVITPKPHSGARGPGPGRSRSATPMHGEPRGRGLGRGIGRGVVSADLRYPPSGIGRGQASLQFS